MRRRAVAVAVAAGAVLLVLVAIGRWERSRWADSQNAGIERVRAAVGPLDSRSLYGYRVLPQFDCLLYRRNDNPYALELCVDATGRIVEALDRRQPERRIYSVRAEPGAATVRLDRAAVDRLLRKMGARRT